MVVPDVELENMMHVDNMAVRTGSKERVGLVFHVIELKAMCCGPEWVRGQ